MKKNILSSVFLASLLLLTSCDRNASGTAKIAIQFPEFQQSSLGKASLRKSLSHSTVDGGTSDGGDGEEPWMDITPTGFSGDYPFNCFGVYVSGPEPELRDNSCKKKSDTAPMRTFGTFKGAVPAGATVEFEVTPGKDRVIGIFGFYAEAGGCTDLTGGKSPQKSKLSKPYFIGESASIEMLAGQTMNVDVPMSFVEDNWFEDCIGPDFPKNESGPGTGPGSGDQSYYYGNGSDGVINVPAGDSDIRSLMSANKGVPLVTTSRVTGYTRPVATDLRLLNVTLKLQGVINKFAIGDEVMLYVAAASNSIPPLTGSGCGPNLWPGFRTSGKIESLDTGATSSNILVRVSDERFSTIPVGALGASAVGVNRDFCYLTATRVPNIESLNFTGASAKLGFLSNALFPDLADSTLDASGGLVFLKVRNSITLNGFASIDVTASGFRGGISTAGFRNGQGIMGILGDTLSVGVELNGGAGEMFISPTVRHAGGGGHGAPGGSGLNAPGSGGFTVGDQYGCNTPTPDASMQCLSGKIFMGGGGGAGSAFPGGAGGGILNIAAKNIVLNNFTLNLAANGGHAGGSSGATGGGGAGGAVHAIVGTVTASAMGALNIEARGGTNMDSSQSNGGAGGGGRTHLTVNESCNVGPNAIRMHSYGGPQSQPNFYGEFGGTGTAFINGVGAAFCNSVALKNVIPWGVRAFPQAAAVGTPLTIYGTNMNNVSEIKLRKDGSEYPCSIVASGVFPNSIECTIPTGAGITAGTYEVLYGAGGGPRQKVPHMVNINL